MFGRCRFCGWLVLRRLVLACTTRRSVVRFRFVRRSATRSCLVLRRFVLGSFVLGGLALSCLIRFGLVFTRLARSGSVLGSLRLSGLIRFRLICRRFVLSRAILGSFIFSGLVLGRLRTSCLIRFRFICSRFVLGRPIRSCFILSRLVLGRLGFDSSVRRCSPARRYYALAGKFARLGRRRDSRTPVIHRREHFVIPTRRLLVACLHGGRRSVRRASECFLRRSRPCADAAASSVEADVA